MSRAINAFTRRYVYAAGALIATLGALVVFGVGTAAVMGLVVGVSKAVSALGGEATTTPTLSTAVDSHCSNLRSISTAQAASLDNAKLPAIPGTQHDASEPRTLDRGPRWKNFA